MEQKRTDACCIMYIPGFFLFHLSVCPESTSICIGVTSSQDSIWERTLKCTLTLVPHLLYCSMRFTYPGAQGVGVIYME